MIRITAGRVGGRLIKSPPGRVRPTQDKVRQALFSSLGDRVVGARVLDLFAGSGALGIEAWSRGAALVWWVEKDLRVFRVLQENVRALCGDDPVSLRCICADADRFLRDAEGPVFDLIFADPPYARQGGQGRLEMALRTVRARSMLAANGVLIFEQGSAEPIKEQEGWLLIRDRRYGGTRLLSYMQEAT